MRTSLEACSQVIAASILGYFVGKFTYADKCADKFLIEAPHSQIAQAIRLRRGIPPLENIDGVESAPGRRWVELIRYRYLLTWLIFRKTNVSKFIHIFLDVICIHLLRIRIQLFFFSVRICFQIRITVRISLHFSVVILTFSPLGS